MPDFSELLTASGKPSLMQTWRGGSAIAANSYFSLPLAGTRAKNKSRQSLAAAFRAAPEMADITDIWIYRDIIESC